MPKSKQPAERRPNPRFEKLEVNSPPTLTAALGAACHAGELA